MAKATKTLRRSFLLGAGALSVASLAKRAAGSPAQQEAPPAAAPKPGKGGGMATGLTLLNFYRDGELSLGVKTQAGVIDVKAAGQALRVRVPATTDDVIRGRDLDGLRAVVGNGGKKGRSALLSEDKLKFGPAVSAPEKILMLGFNYRRHAMETNTPIPTSPVLFNKYANALCGHGATVKLPVKVATKFDHEVELVVVMGKEARDVSEADALSYVFGYATGNDFSARDLQFKTSQFMLGKTSDDFGPLGPYLVTADQVPDPQSLKLECKVNDEVRQSSNTNDMIFSCAQIVSYASKHMTLKPGDIFFTGTPEGVIQGKPEAQRVWLKAGDRITTTIEKLGELRFTLA
jgi:2-keto-4-pentenoate hydratase/2-oxohepta-3-ene-1,7-dioic acid hydratase in catechol pathway